MGKNFCLNQCLLMLLVVEIVGCSREKIVPVFPVKGMLKVNGKPVPNVDVNLLPVDMNPNALFSSGRTNKEGRFNVAATNGRQGAAKGKYKVVLVPSEQAIQAEVIASNGGKPTPESVAAEQRKYMSQKPPGAKKTEAEKSLIPEEFLRKETSPRTIEVVDKELQLELDL